MTATTVFVVKRVSMATAVLLRKGQGISQGKQGSFHSSSVGCGELAATAIAAAVHRRTTLIFIIIRCGFSRAAFSRRGKAIKVIRDRLRAIANLAAKKQRFLSAAATAKVISS